VYQKKKKEKKKKTPPRVKQCSSRKSVVLSLVFSKERTPHRPPRDSQDQNGVAFGWQKCRQEKLGILLMSEAPEKRKQNLGNAENVNCRQAREQRSKM
jgi:hypothetical protein